MSVPAIVSDRVADVAVAVDKLRADDQLITSPDMKLGDAEVLIEAIIGLQAVLVRRLADINTDDTTAEFTGRSTKRWLVEEQLMAGREASRVMRLATRLPAHPL